MRKIAFNSLGQAAAHWTRQLAIWRDSFPLYHLWLRRRPFWPSPVFTPSWIWPDDAALGQAIIDHPRGDHDFAELAALRAVGTAAAAHTARLLIAAWLRRRDAGHPISWAPEIIGARLTQWLMQADFYAPDAALSQALSASIAHQGHYLARRLPHSGLCGSSALHAITGLLLAGLNIPHGTGMAGLALTLLTRQLEAEILADGGHLSRAPQQQAAMLQQLVTLRTILETAQLSSPPALGDAITRMAPALRSLRHGDGGLALFNGATVGNPRHLEAVLTQSGGRSRGNKALTHMGYERLQARRSLLIMDAGAPPPRGFDLTAHAGLLAFEFSHGRQRLIVNCGAYPPGGTTWRQALAATAAHSTLTIDDCNAVEILPIKGIGKRPRQIAARRYDLNGKHYLEAQHNGWRDRNVQWGRVLELSADGNQLCGHEHLIVGGQTADACWRFHLHPSVQIGLLGDGRSALLKPPQGQGWRFHADRPLELGPSLYAGDGKPQKTQHLALRLSATGAQTLSWSLTRV